LPGLAQAQHRRTSPRHADFAAQHWSASPMEPPPRRSPDACLPRPSRHLVIPAAVDSDLPTNSVVIPAKAGIQFLINSLLRGCNWTPAFVLCSGGLDRAWSGVWYPRHLSRVRL